MADNEISKEMIIKALECCSNDTYHDCNACPLNEPSSRCIPKLAKLALDLMRKKDAKIAVESFGHANAKITIDSLLMELDGKDVEIMNLKHKIERLKEEIRNTDNILNSLDRPLIEVKTEAYKKFAEQLGRDEYGQYDWEYKSIIYTQDEIDNALKELMEESK